MGRQKKQPPKVLYALFDAKGELFDSTYLTEKEAHEDAFGPRFRPRYTVRAYRLLTRAQEKELSNG